MATTLNILNIQQFFRSVLQGRTPEPVSCTAMAACTQQAYNALLADSWTRVEERESGLPRHNWAQTGFSNRWDAAKYCGDYADGFQHGYATAVCYTIRMPADALAGTVAKIVSLAIPVYGDRWLADGCDIGVTLSVSATPPAWDAPADDAVTGQLAVTPSNTGTDTSATVVFDWSAAPKTALAYLHITLRLTDYLTHRGAWIEGSAMINGANIAVTFDRAVTPDTETTFDDPNDSLIVPIRLYTADTNRTPITYTGVNVNLASTYLRRHWTVDMLRGGQGSVGTADSVTALTPMLTANGLSMTAQGHIVKAWCPIAAVAGATLWLRAVGSAWPEHSTIRVSVFTGDDMPPVTSPATWAGEGDACIGTQLVTGATEGDTLGVPLSRDGASPLWIVCGFERVSAEDSSLGAADTGISLLDAHISLQPASTDVMPHFLMIGPASGTPIGLMRDPSDSPAEALLSAYAMQRNMYVARNTSSFAWLNPGDVSDEVLQAGIVASGAIDSSFAATVSMEGILRLATNGTLPAALTALEGDSGYLGVAPLAFQCMATLETTGVVAAVSGDGGGLEAAINGASVTDGVAICGYRTTLLIQTATTVQAVGVGLNGSFVSAVASLSGIRTFHGMAIGDKWACFVKTDGTAVALSLADGSADATVATWTNVTLIATAYNAIVAINSSGALLVANGATYAGLDSTSISALNDLYTFSGVIANVNSLHGTPEFALAVSGLA